MVEDRKVLMARDFLKVSPDENFDFSVVFEVARISVSIATRSIVTLHFKHVELMAMFLLQELYFCNMIHILYLPVLYLCSLRYPL